MKGVDASGSTFLDLTKTLDISAGGAFLASARHLNAGSLLQLTIPAPPPITAAYSNIPPETPPIQARVRRQQLSGDLHLVGVEFLTSLD